MNIITKTDSYKVGHWKQYPKDTENVYSYFESRVGAKFKNTLFFGLQGLLKRYFTTAITQTDIDYAAFRFKGHFGQDLFNREGWQHILEAHNGYLPLSIKAVPEGTLVPTGNVLMTVENTDPKVPWLTNYMETVLTHIWYPCTVATQSYEMRQKLLSYLEMTGDPSTIDFKLHDFGFRGVSCFEQAEVGAAAHLVNFKGTDTFAGVEYALNYYGEDMAGFSIPASEHSTITIWGADNELDAMRNMLDQYPTGFIACVSDSYDIYRACSEYWGGALRDTILERDGVLVIRPDSGDPIEVIPAILEILGTKFGYTTNDKGYKVLHPKVRLIQGDGIDYDSLGGILWVMKEHGWSADNIAFGSGGGLLQKLNRDTQRFAFKCSCATVAGEEREVYKAPASDMSKASKRGRLALIRNNDGDLTTVKGPYPTISMGPFYHGDELREVYRNGALIVEDNLSTIRNRVS